MNIIINGAQESLSNFAEPATIATLLEQRGLTGKRVAVERNGEIVPKSCHATTTLHADDKLEIVIAVGGG